MLFCERTTFSLQPQLRNDLLVILWSVCVEESSLFWESPNAAEEYIDVSKALKTYYSFMNKYLIFSM